MISSDVSALDTIVRDAACAEILPRFGRLEAGSVRCKTGLLDLVTDADEAAKRMIAARLAEHFPGCVPAGVAVVVAQMSRRGED